MNFLQRAIFSNACFSEYRVDEFSNDLFHIINYFKQGVDKDSSSVVALNHTMMRELQDENRKLSESVAYMHG